MKNGSVAESIKNVQCSHKLSREDFRDLIAQCIGILSENGIDRIGSDHIPYADLFERECFGEHGRFGFIEERQAHPRPSPNLDRKNLDRITLEFAMAFTHYIQADIYHDEDLNALRDLAVKMIFDMGYENVRSLTTSIVPLWRSYRLWHELAAKHGMQEEEIRAQRDSARRMDPDNFER